MVTQRNPPFPVREAGMSMLIQGNRGPLALSYQSSPCSTLPGVIVFLVAVGCQLRFGEMTQHLRPFRVEAL